MGLFNKSKCYDGYLVSKLDPVVFMMPYIMPRKVDSEVMIELKIDTEIVEKFIKEQRKENIKDLTLYHIVFAALVRAASVTPEINRFIKGNRIYQRKDVKVSMVVKKELAIDGKESTIFPRFDETDTLKDIVEKIKKDADKAFESKKDDSNDFDRFTKILYKIPPVILRGAINTLIFLDKKGILPNFLVNLQPFHSGFFVSNVGSIGLPVIYHHLYEFGTTSCFATIGKKENVNVVRTSGEVVRKRYLPLKFVLDGRICDGFTYSTAVRTIKKCFENPEWLLESYSNPTGINKK